MARAENSRGSFLGLLISMLALFALHPLLERGPLDVVMSCVLLAALWSVSRKPATFAIGLVLSLPALLLKWILHLGHHPWLAVTGLVFSIVFIAFTAVTILTTVMRSRTVTGDTIVGAICSYLLLAVLFAMAYTLLEYLLPGSFTADAGPQVLDSSLMRAVPSGLMYFSVTTLTTLGMGDVRPMTEAAQTLTSFEALAGQLYLAVLIARLVSLHASAPRREH